jgi:misacylated tRNA(Ala) deacylase
VLGGTAQSGVGFSRGEHDDAGGGEGETDDQSPEEREAGRTGEDDGDRAAQHEPRAGDDRRAADDAGAIDGVHALAQTIHTGECPRGVEAAVATRHSFGYESSHIIPRQTLVSHRRRPENRSIFVRADTVRVTEQLYLPDDEYRREFDARVEDVGESDGTVVLDRTLFYKEGGGQPPDHGRLSFDGGECRVVDVRKDHGEIRHTIQGDLPKAGATVHGEIDWGRRHAHMRYHTAQHVVSKVVLDEYGASTAGNQIHTDRARIDFAPAEFGESDLRTIEERANTLIERDLPVTKENRPRADLEDETPDVRSNLDLIPDDVDPLRAVTIGDIDVCPCGGTHVDRLGELGKLTIVDRSSKGADTERIEFVLDAPEGA